MEKLKFVGHFVLFHVVFKLIYICLRFPLFIRNAMNTNRLVETVFIILRFKVFDISELYGSLFDFLAFLEFVDD